MQSADADRPEFAYTGRKLGTAVLLFVLCVVAVITLEPFTFAVPSRVELTWWDGPFEAIANVVLFVPPGFLFALTRSATAIASGRGMVRRAALLGLLASGSIEIAQVFEPTRYPSPTDVAMNVVGAALGAWVFGRAARRLGADTPLVGRLALELPLMGLVYITAPLCTLAAITVRAPAFGGPWIPQPRAWGLAALALFGGTVLGQVQRRHFGPAGTLTPRMSGLAAASWFALGALPALATAPPAFAIGVLLAGASAWAFGRSWDGATPINRRFEQTALLRAAPWLGAYLTLVPLTGRVASTIDIDRATVLVRVESLVGFTILGYVLAEAWGRLELRYRHTAWRVAIVAVAAAVVAESLRRMAMPSIEWAGGVAMHAFAAAYGGWIYHLQRAHVRALVAARTAASVAPVATPTARPSRRRRTA